MKDYGDFNALNVKHDSLSCEQESPKKSVHFADSKGLALTSTHFFPKEKLCCPDEWEVGLSEHARLKHMKVKRSMNGKCARTEILNFRAPASEKCLLEALEKQKVCLEQIMFFDFGIWGRIRVRNLAFEKKVFIRHTFNSWLTYEDQVASYIPGSSTGLTDTFGFRIKFLQDGDGKYDVKKMEFAISYKVGENEFWDNNYGDNYRVVYA